MNKCEHGFEVCIKCGDVRAEEERCGREVARQVERDRERHLDFYVATSMSMLLVARIAERISENVGGPASYAMLRLSRELRAVSDSPGAMAAAIKEMLLAEGSKR